MPSKRVRKMNASGIRKVFELGKSLEGPIDLSIGAPDFAVPENIKKAAVKAIKTNKNSYSLTQGIPELRAAVIKRLKDKNGIRANDENIIITSAVSGGLNLALPSLIDPGDEVIIFDPSFPGYKQQILLFGGVPVSVSKSKDFSIDFSKLEKAVTKKTKAIIFNTPENPTGYVAKMSEIKKLAALAKKYKLTIISDEIYEDFVYDETHISIGKFYKNTVTLLGFSKSHAMTGWRVGYLCAPKELAEEMKKVQQFTYVCAPAPFQYAAIEAFKTDVSKNIESYEKKRDLVYVGLKDHYDIQKSAGAFYFFIRYPYAADKFMQNCLKHKILLVPGAVFSRRDTHFRLSFATSDAKLKKAVKILREISKK